VVDANLLYPARVRDLLIRLDLAGLYQARWTEQILDECFDNLSEDRPELPAAQLARTRDLMAVALPDAIVTDHEGLIEGLALPDPDDRHVLAAAITAEASHLVTQNLDDFPDVPSGLVVVSADEFVLDLANHDLDAVATVLNEQAGSLTNPPMTAMELLAGLEAVGLNAFVDRVRPSLI